jgi:hypothetical protein
MLQIHVPESSPSSNGGTKKAHASKSVGFEDNCLCDEAAIKQVVTRRSRENDREDLLLVLVL